MTIPAIERLFQEKLEGTVLSFDGCGVAIVSPWTPTTPEHQHEAE